MRPRLLHLGYASDKFFGDLDDAASMRPRLLHLGYFFAICFQPRLIHSFNEAEAFTPRIFGEGRSLGLGLLLLQ